MKTRPIGTIVARDPTCNIILHADAQDPKKGSAMRLADDLNALSEGQRMEIRDFLQNRMDDTCTQLAQIIQEMLRQEPTAEPEQAVLDLEPAEDVLEIPQFFRRNTQ